MAMFEASPSIIEANSFFSCIFFTFVLISVISNQLPKQNDIEFVERTEKKKKQSNVL